MKKDKENELAKRCDECGRGMIKAHRTLKNHRYCASCYARVFERRMCPKCKNFARLLKNDSSAICTKCQKNKPCVRCMKTEYKIGKITPYGPVCNACSIHFKEPEPCEVCSKLSSRLTRLTRLGHNHRVCPQCARADHGTCRACRRHRLLQKSPDNRMLCRRCIEKGNIPCQKCGGTMPAGYGNQCELCYRNGLLNKRIKIDCAAFSSAIMATYFEEFGLWLGNKVGLHKASLTIHKYLIFFISIERQWRSIPEYFPLLDHFGTHALRKVLLPICWMEEKGLIKQDSAAKKAHSDNRRITATLDRIPKGSMARSILGDYYEMMLKRQKNGKVTLTTIRMALSSASALLVIAVKMESIPPNQKAVETYLAKAPGQRASISGFVRYLRETHGADISLPIINKNKVKENRRKKLEKEMLTLMYARHKNQNIQRKWISTALAYFHGLPKKIGGEVKLEDIIQDVDGGISINWNNTIYWLPKYPRLP